LQKQILISTFVATNKKQMRKGTKYWLRWAAVLPVAIIAALIASVLVRTILYYTVFLFLSPKTTIMESVLAPVLNAAGFIFFGSIIAPEQNKKTLLILFFLFLVLLGTVALFAFSGAELLGRKVAFVNGLALSGFSILGACIGLSLSSNRYKKQINNAGSGI
jgi:hypothetical protein